jgi:hypothetical protein
MVSVNTKHLRFSPRNILVCFLWLSQENYYFASWDFRRSVVEDPVLLGYDAASLDNGFPTFRRNTLPSASRMYRAETPEDERNILARSIGNRLPIDTASHPRRTESTTIISLYNIHQLIFLMEANCSPSDVRTESLCPYKLWLNFSLEVTLINVFLDFSRSKSKCSVGTGSMLHWFFMLPSKF